MTNKPEHESFLARISDDERILAALRLATNDALLWHKQMEIPIATSIGGTVTLILPGRIETLDGASAK